MNLAKIFLDTQELYNTNSKLIAACEYSRSNQMFVGANESIDCEVNRFDADCKILVSKSLSAMIISSFLIMFLLLSCLD